MSALDTVQALAPDECWIGIVRAKSSSFEGRYLVQGAGMGHDIYCRSIDAHAVGDSVIVLNEPNETLPLILGLSPWQVHDPTAVVSPGSYVWTDITDREAATSASPDVAANTAARHARAHTLLNPLDHNASGSNTNGSPLGYSGGAWQPVTVVMDGGTW